MSKSIEFTPLQIKAKEAGATMFLFYIKDQKYAELALKRKGIFLEEFIKFYSPIQKGDKDIFVQEEFIICEHENYSDHVSKGTYISYDTKSTNHFRMEWFPASQMTKEQSRYSFNECIDIKIVKFGDIDLPMITNILGEIKLNCSFVKAHRKAKQQFKKIYNLKDNDYVFLIKFT